MLGCAVKRPARTDLILDLKCISGTIVLKDCINSDPNRCAHSVITYKKGCEYIVVHKSK